METGRAGCTNNHPPGSKIQASSSCDEDVLIEILLCLPVKSLLRFKSVCKSWCSIIESPFFIHLHATTSTTLQQQQQQQPSSFFKLGHGGCSSLLFEEEKEKKKRGNFFTLSGEEFEVFRDLDRPTPLVCLGDDDYFMKLCVMGCCNGIICLHDRYTRNVVLWNPAIKQSKVVPKPLNLLGNPNCYDDDNSYYVAEDVIAFGFDIKTKDYKVLLITTLEPSETNYGSDGDYDYDDDERFMPPSQSLHARRVHVYSSSTDSWRCIDDDTLSSAAHPNHHLRMDCYVNESLCLNGSYFFIAYCQIEVEYMSLIMSFDFTEEIFRTIQPPYDWRNNDTITSKVYFIPFDEKIALVDAKSDGFYRLECDIWVLNELHNGVKESWTKFYTFGHSYGSYRSPIQYPIALRCIANNGQFAIIYNPGHGQHRGEHVWKSQLLNLITGETKDLLSGVDLNISIYKPSLVKIGRSGASTNEKCK